uniref:(northern house mosquito) hypothetical protein n=1 Tax=Culex pipiens TaxID=7175 RepID=A0A8D8P5Z2_CULPI
MEPAVVPGGHHAAWEFGTAAVYGAAEGARLSGFLYDLRGAGDRDGWGDLHGVFVRADGVRVWRGTVRGDVRVRVCAGTGRLYELGAVHAVHGTLPGRLFDYVLDW